MTTNPTPLLELLPRSLLERRPLISCLLPGDGEARATEDSANVLVGCLGVEVYAGLVEWVGGGTR